LRHRDNVAFVGGLDRRAKVADELASSRERILLLAAEGSYPESFCSPKQATCCRMLTSGGGALRLDVKHGVSSIDECITPSIRRVHAAHKEGE